jgi:phospho-N-acetylmuramoyl-pentapeptide-transferase
MMYYVSYLSREFGPFRVFEYSTFRGLAAALTAFLISFVSGKRVIRKLISLKFGQPIRTREEVKQLFETHGRKKGTPTMGGVLIIISVIISALLWARPTNPPVWLALFTIVYLGALGFVDDYLKVTKSNSKGVSGRVKLVAQFILSAGVVSLFLFGPRNAMFTTDLYVPFLKRALIPNMGLYCFGLFAFLFYGGVIVGCSNAVNLTDGLDGLAAGCTVTVAGAYAVLTFASSNIRVAEYLQIPFFPGSGELTVLCSALAGAGLGFLWFNAHPAQVFMGDTGSLAIGGFIAIVAICCKQELLLVLIGGVFVMEAGSVIIQVASFKLTGKRVFAMSPLHHHFELLDWKETTVVVRFWILSIIFAILGLATLKLR